MANDNVSLMDEIELGLANAKRLERDARAVKGDFARVRDSYIQEQHNNNVQTKEVTTDNGTANDSH